MIILFTLLLNTFLRVSSNENILLQKPISTNENSKNSKNLNDGNSTTYFEFQSSALKWAVFYLKGIYEVKKVIIKTDTENQNVSVSLYVGDSFTPCIFHRQKETYKSCKIGVVPNAKINELKCDELGIKGQYLALVIDIFSLGTPGTFELTEIEGFGDLITEEKPKSRPEMKSVSLKPISEEAFKISKQIRKDVPFVLIPRHSTGLVFFKNNCEPIVYDDENKKAFSIVCQTDDGKGRITMFGKNDFFHQLIEKDNMETFKLNLLQWLSPTTPNPNFIKSEKIKSLKDLRQMVKKGDIIDFNVWDPTPNDILQELKLMMLNGSIGMNIDHTFWVETSNEARESYMEILNIFNVDFSSYTLNLDEEKNITLSDKDFSEWYFGLEEKLLRMSENHELFLKMSIYVISEIDDIPINILSKTKLRDNMVKLINKYYNLLQWICPTQENLLSDKNDRIIVAFFSTLMKNQLLVNSNYKMPCVDLFPGDFNSPPPKECVTINIKSQTPQTLHPIGYYLAPGETLNYNILNVEGEWSISVGCHSDILDDKRPKWSRYPDIMVEQGPLQNNGSVYSPFGGVIWLYSNKDNKTISISLNNVVATPFFNTRDQSSINQWNENKNSAGLWAQIIGSNIVFCVESYKIKNFNDNYLYNIMNMWDLIVRSDYYMKSEDFKFERSEIVVLDIMTKVGDGHDGYPIVVWNDWFENIFDMNKILQKGSWGMCHEIGHNMQESAWTFSGTREVSNNLFCLYNYKKVWNLPYYGSEELKLYRNYDRTNETQNYLDEGANFEVWKSEPFIALLIYAQFVNHFGFGFYKEVFYYYKINKLIDFKDDDDKIAMWMNVTSIISNQNLLPIFDFWGFPISCKIQEALSHLPCFFPDDFYRFLSEKRTTYIENKYINCDNKSTFFKDFSITDVSREYLPNFIEISNEKWN